MVYLQPEDADFLFGHVHMVASHPQCFRFKSLQQITQSQEFRVQWCCFWHLQTMRPRSALFPARTLPQSCCRHPFRNGLTPERITRLGAQLVGLCLIARVGEADYEIPMSNDSDLTRRGHSPINPLTAKRRWWPWLLLIILALVCAGGIYAWPEIAMLVPALGREVAGEGAGDKDVLPDILATQQKIEEDLATLDRAVADQQDQVKIIIDQLVALASQVETLQQRPVQVPVPPPAAAAPVRLPIAQAARKPRKPPSPTPQTSGPISIGGAPLNVAPAGH
jgi:hypothetical protein